MTAPKQAATEVASTAKDQAVEVGGTAAAAAKDVAGTAKEQAATVLGESLDQAKDLAESVRTQLSDQISSQSERLTTSLRQLSEQLTTGDTSGVVGQVLTEAGQRLQQLVDRVERTGPQGLVRDLRTQVKSSPGTFLLGAALAGLASGRLVKGMRAAGPSATSPTSPAWATGSTGSAPATNSIGQPPTLTAVNANPPGRPEQAPGTATGTPLAGRTTPMGTGVSAGYAPSTEPGVSYETPDVDPTPLADAYPLSTDDVTPQTTQPLRTTPGSGGVR